MKKKLEKIIKTLVFISLGVSFLNFFKIDLYLELSFFKLISLLVVVILSLIFTKKSTKYLINNRKTTSIEQIFLKREKTISIFFLLVFFIFLTFFRSKFFTTPFTTDHPMKYAAYVEPAKYMVKSKNIFNYQKKYYLNDISNLKGEKLDLNHFPIFEWLLASIYYFSDLPIELVTRIFLHLLLIANLILIYIYLSKTISHFTSLLATSIIAFNPIINFSHYVTVIDSFLITFTFFSLILFERYQKTNKVNYLILSAITLGIGTITKSSIFIWTYPILFITSFLKNGKNYKKTIIENFILLFLALGQFLPLILVVFNYPKINIYQNLLNTLLWITALVMLFSFINKFLFKKLNQLKANTIYIGAIFILITLTIILFSLKEKFFFYADDFLVNKDLIFYFPMYEKIFKNLLVFIVEPKIIYVFLVSVIISCFKILKREKIDILVISFFTSFFSYLIIASKVIYIHNYYNIFLIIPVLISLYVLIDKIRKINFYVYFFIISILSIYLLFISKTKVLEIMSFYRINYLEIQDYVKTNTSSSNRCIYSINTYSYYAPIIDSEEINGNQILESKEFVSDVNVLGLENTLKKYNINCFIQEKNENNYKDFFTNIYGNKIIFNNLTREEIIKGKKQNLIDNKNYIEQLELNMNYDLIKETQNFKIYLLN